MKTINTTLTKRIRNELRTPTHTVWFEPKTGTYEALDVHGKRFTIGNAIAVCYLLYPNDAIAHQTEVLMLRERLWLVVDIDDPREGYAE